MIFKRKLFSSIRAWHNICISQSTGRILLRATPTTSRTINSFRSFLFNITSCPGKSGRRYGGASCEIYLRNLAVDREYRPLFTRISVHGDGRRVRRPRALVPKKYPLREIALLKGSILFINLESYSVIRIILLRE